MRAALDRARAIGHALLAIAVAFGYVSPGTGLAGDRLRSASSGAAPSPIALIDIRHVLEHDGVFRERKDALEAGAALAEAALRRQKDQLRELSQRLRGLRTGSAEHTEVDLEILRRTSALKTQEERARDKLAAEDARIHREAYREIVRAVDGYLDETDFHVVLRIDASDATSGTGRASQGRAGEHHTPIIPRSLVFTDGGVDITGEILRRLETDRRKSAARMRAPSRR